MKSFTVLLIIIELSTASAQIGNYVASMSELGADQKKILFNLNAQKKAVGDDLYIDVSVLDQSSNEALNESAKINKNTAEIMEYKVTNNQTKERGLVTVKDKIKIEYTSAENKTQIKEINKPSRLVAPANFEIWITKNFEELKKEKSLVVDFLIWDRLETIKFKVSYLGETLLNNETTHLFKMNINNFILASFISPIKIWYSQDMSQLRLYEGRVAARKKTDAGYKDLNARVSYIYK
jgi:hypothetical protein